VDPCVKRYTDGELRPSRRGVFHLVVACLLPIGIIVLLALWPDEWPLALFMLGKESSYVASAIFHRFAGLSENVQTHIFSRQLDKLAISVSIFAAGFPTSFSDLPFYAFTEACFFLPCIILVIIDRELSAGEKSVRRNSFRTLMLLQFAFTAVFVGSASTWSSHWIIGTSCYVIGFVIYAAGLVRKEFKLFPWHKNGRNGAHEDFHVLIFVGDVFYFVNAVFYGR